jgi:hypothetical protein
MLTTLDRLIVTAAPVTAPEDMPVVRVIGLSDLIRSSKDEFHAGWFGEQGSSCALGGALKEIYRNADL